MSEVYGFQWAMKGSMRCSKIKDPKNGSKYKKLLKEPNHENIVNFLTAEKGNGAQQIRIPMNQSTEALSQEKLWCGFISLLMSPYPPSI